MPHLILHWQVMMPEITKFIITITGKKYKYFFATFSVGDSETDSFSEDGDCASSDFPEHASVSLMAAGFGGIPSFSSKFSLNLYMVLNDLKCKVGQCYI